MKLLEDFLRDIDRHWTPLAAGRQKLQLIGSTALMLQTDYRRGTNDSDVLESADLSANAKAELLQLAGKGSDIHKRHRIYADVVASGLPFLAQVPHFHALTRLNSSLNHLQVEVLDVVDVAVSKLKRFHSDDRKDIDAMVGAGLIEHRQLVARFTDAADWCAYTAMGSRLRGFLVNLHSVERDSFGEAESDIALPDLE